MKRGPRPKPRKLKVLEGTYRADRDGGLDLPPGALPEPAWSRVLPGKNGERLRKEASAEWRRVVPDLSRLGVLSHIDRSSIVAYCIQWARFVECLRRISVDGLELVEEITNKAGATYKRRMRHPLETTVKDCETALNRYRQSFGLEPSSRGRLAVPGLDHHDGDEIARRVFGD
jgi:P27 family predicted phage terminase small subunit